MMFFPARVLLSTQMLSSAVLLQSTTTSCEFISRPSSSSHLLPRNRLLARFSTSAAHDPSDDDDDDDKLGFDDEDEDEDDGQEEDHEENEDEDEEDDDEYADEDDDYDEDSEYGGEDTDERRKDTRDLFNYSDDDVNYGEQTGITIGEAMAMNDPHFNEDVVTEVGVAANTDDEEEDEYTSKLKEYYSTAGSLSVAEAFEQDEKRWHVDRLSSFSRPEKPSDVLTDIEELMMEQMDSQPPKALADWLKLMSRCNDVFIFDPDFFRMAESRTLQTLEHWRVRDIAVVLMATLKLPQWNVSSFFLSALAQRALELRDDCTDGMAEKIVQIVTCHERFKEPSPNWVVRMLRHVPDAEVDGTVTRITSEPFNDVPDDDDVDKDRAQRVPTTTYRVKFTPEDFANDDQYSDHPEYAQFKRLQKELIEEEGQVVVSDPSRWYIAPETHAADHSERAVGKAQRPTGRAAIDSYRAGRLLRNHSRGQRSSARAAEAADDGEYQDFDVDDGFSDDDIVLSDDDENAASPTARGEAVSLEPEAPIDANGRRKFNPRAINWATFDPKSFNMDKYDFTGVDLEGFAKESFPNMSPRIAQSVSAAQREIDRQTAQKSGE